MRPFVATPAGPPTETGPVAARAAAAWGLPAPTWLRTGMTAIYVAGEVVIRIARTTAPAEAALALAAMLTAAGVRVPAARRADVVRVGDWSATAWERLVPAAGAADWTAIGRMVRRVHELPDEVWPADYPRPVAMTFPWWRFDELLTEVGPELDPPARDGLAAAVARCAPLLAAAEPTTTTVHGDVHPGNVMQTADGAVLLDWDLLARGPVAWDHAMLVRADRWVGYDVGWYADFAAGYGWSGADDPLTQALGELRLVAATLLRWRAARTDPSVRLEADRRLAYWRGEPDAPRWQPM